MQFFSLSLLTGLAVTVAALGVCPVLAQSATPTTALGAAAAPSATASSAPAAKPPDTAAVLARSTANAQVTVADVLAELQRAPAETRTAILANPELVQQITNSLLLRRVLAAQALRDGLTDDPVLAANVVLARERVLSDARLAKIDAQNTPTEATLEAYARNVYQVNQASYEQPAQTRARHILLTNKGADALQRAKDMLAQLRAGASFEELAKTHSLDGGSGARGGDLGFFAPGKMVKPFDAAVAKLQKPGELSEIVESEFGYHIIRLEERRDKRVKPFAEVREQLLAEARRALLTDGRNKVAQALGKDFSFDDGALQALAKSSAAQ